MATLQAICYPNGSPPSLPTAVMVQFDSEITVIVSLFQYPSSSKLERGNALFFQMPTLQLLLNKNHKVVAYVNEDDYA